MTHLILSEVVHLLQALSCFQVIIYLLLRVYSSEIASSYFFRASKVWSVLHHGQWERIQNKIRQIYP